MLLEDLTGAAGVSSEGRKVQCEGQHEGKAPGEVGTRNQSLCWVESVMGRAAESWHETDAWQTGWHRVVLVND